MPSPCWPLLGESLLCLRAAFFALSNSPIEVSVSSGSRAVLPGTLLADKCTRSRFATDPNFSGRRNWNTFQFLPPESVR